MVYDIRFQYYSGSIFDNEPKGIISLKEFIQAHKTPTPETVKVIKAIRDASNIGDKALKKRLKEQGLFFVTPAIIVNNYRRYDDIVEFTGVAQLDFDNIDNAREFKEFLFNEYKQFYCVYVSPSGKGVKALIRIPKSEDIEEFRAYYRAIITEFEIYDGFDEAPKNAVLPLFISYDYFIDYNFEPELWDKKEEEATDLRELYPLPQTPYKATKKNERNKARAINTIRKAISSIIGTPGHTQLRSSCLILGTRVGAGYLDYYTAWNEIESLVLNNAYLSKGVKGYLKTARWGLDEGVKTPKNY